MDHPRNDILRMLEEGILNPHDVLLACLRYMSDGDIRDMMMNNGWIDDEESDDE